MIHIRKNYCIHKIAKNCGKVFTTHDILLYQENQTSFDAVQHMIIMYVSVSLNLFNPYDLFFLNEIFLLTFMHLFNDTKMFFVKYLVIKYLTKRDFVANDVQVDLNSTSTDIAT